MVKIKLLAIIPDKGGIGFFRVMRPHMFIDEHYSNEFDITLIQQNEFDFKDANFGLEYDIIYFRVNVGGDYKRWQDKIRQFKSKNIKVICDIDDYWKGKENIPNPLNDKQFMLNQNTPQKVKEDEIRKYNAKKSIPTHIVENLILSDYIVTTTPIFQKEISKHNKNVVVLENAVDGEDKQFQKDYSASDRLRVGLILGSSHEKDVELLKGVVNMFTKDELNKIQFVLCGFDLRGEVTVRNPNTGELYNRQIRGDESVWGTYERIITNNYSIVSSDYKKYLLEFNSMTPYPNERNEPYIRRWTLPINKYATHYNHIDVLLVPLVNDDFNTKKSQLKVVESAFKGKAIIASNVGPYTIDLKTAYEKGGIINEKGNSILINKDGRSKDWHKAIKLLLNNKELRLKIADNLYKDITEKYSLLTITKKRTEFYKNILNK